MPKVEEALEIAEALYEYSILNKNEYVKEKSKQLVRNLVILTEQNNNNKNYDKDYTEEIEKVKRKVPKWMKKTHQANYRILKAYMDLSDCNEHSIGVEELEEYVDMEKVFLGHYNGLKTISEKNHAKVFEEVNKQVKLWEPVAEFIIGVFTEKSFMDKNVKEYNFRTYMQQTVENESTVNGYIRSLREDFPTKLNIDNILNIVDIDFLEDLYNRCSTNGDLHEWSYAIGNGRPMSAIKKYIDFLTQNK